MRYFPCETLYCFTLLCFSFNNYVSLRYIQLSWGNIIATFLGKSCQLCLPSVYFVAAYFIYLSLVYLSSAKKNDVYQCILQVFSDYVR